MSESAQVASIEKLQDFKAALARFGAQAQGALDVAALEVRRAVDWLQDCLRGWLRETDLRREDVNRARADLSHARAMHRGERVGTTEQEIALHKAQQRLREAEAKVESARRWLRLLPDAIREFEGPARHLNGLLEADLRQGLAVLEGKIAALEAYAGLTAPRRPETTTESGPAPQEGKP